MIEHRHPMTLPLWRSMSSLNLMLPKEERRAMLLRLFNDDSPLVDHSEERRMAIKDAKAAAASSTAQADEETVEDDDQDGGVKLNADGDVDMEDSNAAATVIGTEEDVLAKEDALKAQQQVDADEEQKIAAAPEREGETDEFNTTV